MVVVEVAMVVVAAEWTWVVRVAIVWRSSRRRKKEERENGVGKHYETLLLFHRRGSLSFRRRG